MVEPVGLLGTVVSCVGVVATLTVNVSQYVHVMKRAPQDLLDFERELIDFDALLDQVKAVLRRPEKRKTIKGDCDYADKLVKNCKKALTRVQLDFQEQFSPEKEITILRRMNFLMKKDTFVALRAHLGAVSQTLQVLLTKVTVTETINIAITTERIDERTDRIMEAMNNFTSVVMRMEKKVTALEGHAAKLDGNRHSLNRQQLAEMEMTDLDAVVQEAYTGAENIRLCYEAARLFDENMREQTQTIHGSEAGSNDRRIAEWTQAVAAESGSSTVDEGIDMSPPIHALDLGIDAMPNIANTFKDDDMTEHPEYHDPDVLLAEVEFYQKEEERQIAVSAFSEAKKNQRISIQLLERLEHVHKRPFTKRVEMMQRLARITMFEGKPESFVEARQILQNLKQHLDSENKAMLSELDHSLAVTFVEEFKAMNSVESRHNRDLTEKDINLLRKAELSALKALNDRRQLAGPPRDLMRESVTFLIELYDWLKDPAKRFAFNKHYGKYLVDNATDPKKNHDDLEPLRPLSISGHSDNHQFSQEELWLMERGFDIGPRDFINVPHEVTKYTPLITAIRQNDASSDEMARRFIFKMEADVNRVDAVPDFKLSPLMWAVKLKNLPLVQVLLDRHADTTAKDKKQRGLFHYGVATDSTRILDKLYVVDTTLVNAVAASGETPLHSAVDKDSLKTVKFLLNRNAEINARDQNGDTALHIAVRIHSQEITNHLLMHNPDPYLRNNEGRTALEDSQQRHGRRSKLTWTLRDYETAQGSAENQTRRRTASGLTAPLDGMERTLSNASAVVSPRHDSSGSGGSLAPAERQETRRSFLSKISFKD